jgi:predicted TIM-barrel fold metal-dependent hydrolase
MIKTDVHQHLWSERLLALLAARTRPPLLRRVGGDWVLRLDGEPEVTMDPAAHDPDSRAGELREAGIDRGLVCLSSPLGIESLPPEEAVPLLHAHNDDTLALDAPFGAWGALALGLGDAGADAVDGLLDRGAVGISLPAAALATRTGLARCAQVLERLERRSRPLLVHPGPAPWGARPRGADDVPGWWPALTDYVAQMSAAWHAFVAWGRPAHPELRVVFAMLAGGAPLHLERLDARGGPVDAAHDPGLFYDTSSYGARAIDAMVRSVGIDQLVHASDRPVVEPRGAPPLGDAAEAAMLVANPERLLGDPVGVRERRPAVAA